LQDVILGDAEARQRRKAAGEEASKKSIKERAGESTFDVNQKKVRM